MDEEKTVGRLPEIVRIGGYLVASGALIGFSTGLYLLLNRALFSFFIRIAQHEIITYFIGVFIPSFVILIVIGYLFATTLRLTKAGLSNIVPLIVASFLSLILSALTIFYIVSFLGGFLILAALIKAYTRPAFKALSTREAFFMVELGVMLVAFFSLLFLSMGFLASVFETYSMGLFVSSSPYALLFVGVLSFFTFFVIPQWGSQGTNAGVCGGLGLVMSILSYLFVVQNQYVLFNASAYVGMSMLVMGLISAVAGELLYVKLFFFEPTASFSVPASSVLYQGEYCSYCGKPRLTAVQKMCSNCGRSLMWTPYAPFCTSCGRLISNNVDACPHCKEDIRNKRSYFQLRTTTEQAIVTRLEIESKKKTTLLMKGLLKTSSILRRILNLERLRRAIDRLGLTLKETVVILILTYLLGFISFIGYVRVDTQNLGTAEIIISHYGLPFECLQVKIWPFPMSFVYDVVILWIPLAFDVLSYMMASFALVYGIARWKR